jgi:hypothetical protein
MTTEPRKTYRVRADGSEYTVDLTEGEREDLQRQHQNFVSVEQVTPDVTFDYEDLADDIYKYI